MAAVVFGAVRRTAHQPFTVQNGGQNFNGSAAREGKFATNLLSYTPVLREYCNVGDPICAPGSKDGDISKHLSYFRLYNGEVTEWIRKKARESGEIGGKRSGMEGKQGGVRSGAVRNGWSVVLGVVGVAVVGLWW